MNTNRFVLAMISGGVYAAAAAPAAAQWWWPPQEMSVSPPCRDPSTVVSLTLGGTWNDSCPPNFSSAQVTGNEIDFVTVRDPPPGFCLTVLTAWSRTETVGPLAVGTYTVFATHMVAGKVVHLRTLMGTFDVVASCGGTCYANCDQSTQAPILNVNDFQCFLAQFAAGASYANCDNSTTPPVLNVNDFQCFLAAFAAGCP